MNPRLRNFHWWVTCNSDPLFSKPPRFMSDSKKSIWIKVLNFVIEILKLIIAIFLGVQATNLL